MADNRVDIQLVGSADFKQAYAELGRLKTAIADVSKQSAKMGNLGINSQALKQAQKDFIDNANAIKGINVEMVKLADGARHLTDRLLQNKRSMSEMFVTWRSGSKNLSADIKQIGDYQARLNQSMVVPTAALNGQAAVITNLGQMVTKTQSLEMGLKAYNTEMRNLSNNMINFGKNTQWSGRQLTVGITVPLMAAGGAISAMFYEVDKSMRKLLSVYGVGGTGSFSKILPSALELDKIKNGVMDLSQELAKMYGQSAVTTTGIAADLAAAGYAQQGLLDLTKTVSDAMVIGQTDQQSAIKATIALQNTYRLTTMQTGDALAFFSAAQAATSTSMRDLIDAIPRVGPIMKNLNGTYKDTVAMLVAMKEGGVAAGEGANALKNSLQRIIAPSEGTIKRMQMLNINLKEIGTAGSPVLMIEKLQESLKGLDSVSRQVAITDIFGKYQAARITALLDNFNRSGTQSAKVMQMMSLSAQDLAEIQKNQLATLQASPSMQFASAIESLKTSLLPIGEALLKAVTPIVNAVTWVVEAFQKIGPIKYLFAGGLGLAAIMGPMIMFVGLISNLAGQMFKISQQMRMFKEGFQLGGGMKKPFSALMEGIKGTQNYLEDFDAAEYASKQAADQLTLSAQEQAQSFKQLTLAMSEYRQELNLIMNSGGGLPGGGISGGGGYGNIPRLPVGGPMAPMGIVGEASRPIRVEALSVTLANDRNKLELAGGGGIEFSHMRPSKNTMEGSNVLNIPGYDPRSNAQGNFGIVPGYMTPVGGIGKDVNQKLGDRGGVPIIPTGINSEDTVRQILGELGIGKITDAMVQAAMRDLSLENIGGTEAAKLAQMRGLGMLQGSPDALQQFRGIKANKDATGADVEAFFAQQFDASWEQIKQQAAQDILTLYGQAQEETAKAVQEGRVDPKNMSDQLSLIGARMSELISEQYVQIAARFEKSFLNSMTINVENAEKLTNEMKRKTSVRLVNLGSLAESMTNPFITALESLIQQSRSLMGQMTQEAKIATVQIASMANRGAIEGVKTLGRAKTVPLPVVPLEPRPLATGGKVFGPGGPKDDLIPAMLSDGEYVVKADAVGHYGSHFLDAVNTKKLASGGIARLHSGGKPGHPHPHPPSNSTTRSSPFSPFIPDNTGLMDAIDEALGNTPTNANKHQMVGAHAENAEYRIDPNDPKKKIKISRAESTLESSGYLNAFIQTIASVKRENNKDTYWYWLNNWLNKNNNPFTYTSQLKKMRAGNHPKDANDFKNIYGLLSNAETHVKDNRGKVNADYIGAKAEAKYRIDNNMFPRSVSDMMGTYTPDEKARIQQIDDKNKGYQETLERAALGGFMSRFAGGGIAKFAEGPEQTKMGGYSSQFMKGLYESVGKLPPTSTPAMTEEELKTFLMSPESPFYGYDVEEFFASRQAGEAGLHSGDYHEGWEELGLSRIIVPTPEFAPGSSRMDWTASATVSPEELAIARAGYQHAHGDKSVWQGTNREEVEAGAARLREHLAKDGATHMRLYRSLQMTGENAVNAPGQFGLMDSFMSELIGTKKPYISFSTSPRIPKNFAVPDLIGSTPRIVEVDVPIEAIVGIDRMNYDTTAGGASEGFREQEVLVDISKLGSAPIRYVTPAGLASLGSRYEDDKGQEIRDPLLPGVPVAPNSGRKEEADFLEMISPRAPGPTTEILLDDIHSRVMRTVGGSNPSAVSFVEGWKESTAWGTGAKDSNFEAEKEAGIDKVYAVTEDEIAFVQGYLENLYEKTLSRISEKDIDMGFSGMGQQGKRNRDLLRMVKDYKRKQSRGPRLVIGDKPGTGSEFWSEQRITGRTGREDGATGTADDFVADDWKEVQDEDYNGSKEYIDSFAKGGLMSRFAKGGIAKYAGTVMSGMVAPFQQSMLDPNEAVMIGTPLESLLSIAGRGYMSVEQAKAAGLQVRTDLGFGSDPTGDAIKLRREAETALMGIDPTDPVRPMYGFLGNTTGATTQSYGQLRMEVDPTWLEQQGITVTSSEGDSLNRYIAAGATRAKWAPGEVVRPLSQSDTPVDVLQQAKPGETIRNYTELQLRASSLPPEAIKRYVMQMNADPEGSLTLDNLGTFDGAPTADGIKYQLKNMMSTQIMNIGQMIKLKEEALKRGTNTAIEYYSRIPSGNFNYESPGGQWLGISDFSQGALTVRGEAKGLIQAVEAGADVSHVDESLGITQAHLDAHQPSWSLANQLAAEPATMANGGFMSKFVKGGIAGLLGGGSLGPQWTEQGHPLISDPEDMRVWQALLPGALPPGVKSWQESPDYHDYFLRDTVRRMMLPAIDYSAFNPGYKETRRYGALTRQGVPSSLMTEDINSIYNDIEEETARGTRNFYKNGGLAKFAYGGKVLGPGGPKDDLIPAMISNGEYVVNADAVGHYGKGFMDSINSKKLAGGGIAGFAGGSGIGAGQGLGLAAQMASGILPMLLGTGMNPVGNLIMSALDMFANQAMYAGQGFRLLGEQAEPVTDGLKNFGNRQLARTEMVMGDLSDAASGAKEKLGKFSDKLKPVNVTTDLDRAKKKLGEFASSDESIMKKQKQSDRNKEELALQRLGAGSSVDQLNVDRIRMANQEKNRRLLEEKLQGKPLYDEPTETKPKGFMAKAKSGLGKVAGMGTGMGGMMVGSLASMGTGLLSSKLEEDAGGTTGASQALSYGGQTLSTGMSIAAMAGPAAPAVLAATAVATVAATALGYVLGDAAEKERHFGEEIAKTVKKSQEYQSSLKVSNEAMDQFGLHTKSITDIKYDGLATKTDAMTESVNALSSAMENGSDSTKQMIEYIKQGTKAQQDQALARQYYGVLQAGGTSDQAQATLLAAGKNAGLNSFDLKGLVGSLSGNMDKYGGRGEESTKFGAFATQLDSIVVPNLEKMAADTDRLIKTETDKKVDRYSYLTNPATQSGLDFIADPTGEKGIYKPNNTKPRIENSVEGYNLRDMGPDFNIHALKTNQEATATAAEGMSGAQMLSSGNADVINTAKMAGITDKTTVEEAERLFTSMTSKIKIMSPEVQSGITSFVNSSNEFKAGFVEPLKNALGELSHDESLKLLQQTFRDNENAVKPFIDQLVNDMGPAFERLGPEFDTTAAKATSLAMALKTIQGISFDSAEAAARAAEAIANNPLIAKNAEAQGKFEADLAKVNQGFTSGDFSKEKFQRAINQSNRNEKAYQRDKSDEAKERSRNNEDESYAFQQSQRAEQEAFKKKQEASQEQVKSIQKEMDARQKLYDLKNKQIQQDQTMLNMQNNISKARNSGDLLGLAAAQSTYNNELNRQNSEKAKTAADEKDQNKIKEAQDKMEADQKAFDEKQKAQQEAFDLKQHNFQMEQRNIDDAAEAHSRAREDWLERTERNMRKAAQIAETKKIEIIDSESIIEKSMKSNLGVDLKTLYKNNDEVKAAIKKISENTGMTEAEVLEKYKALGKDSKVWSDLGGFQIDGNAAINSLKMGAAKITVGPDGAISVGPGPGQGSVVDFINKAGAAPGSTGQGALMGGQPNGGNANAIGPGGAQGAVMRADGGHIQGPGTGTSDSIPAMLSDGEYVVKASSVKKYGTGFMNSINAGHYADGGMIQKFAEGGLTISGHRAPPENLKTFSVAGGRTIDVADWSGPMFQSFLEQWQNSPQLGGNRLSLNTGPLDSYEYRTARAAGGVSDHAGYAIDIRYDILEADNKRHMSDAEQSSVHNILSGMGGKLKWGGDYQRLIDEMHVYVAPGVNGPNDVPSKFAGAFTSGLAGQNFSERYITGQKLLTLLAGTGFRGDELRTAFGVVMGESGGDRMGKNFNKASSSGAARDNYDWGLFQMNDFWNLDVKNESGATEKIDYSYDKITDAIYNARIGYLTRNDPKYSGWNDWNSWRDKSAAYQEGINMFDAHPELLQGLSYGQISSTGMPSIANLSDGQRMSLAGMMQPKWGNFMATGGQVSGPGGPRSDLIPAMLSNGEFVMNAAAVSKYGVDVMRLINSGKLDPRFANPMARSGLMNPSAGNSSNATSNNVEYNINVEVAGSNASPEDIARVVMNTLKQKEKANMTRRTIG